MIKIYHNPRCSKSREGVNLLKESGEDFEIVEYLKDTLSKKELNEIIKMLDIKPIDLVRKNEVIWREQYKDREMSDDEVLEAMIENPRLIERPIVVKDNQAIIGRPPALIKDLL